MRNTVSRSNDWINILNNGKGQIDLILNDISRVFDVVPNHCLITKLYIYGITSKAKKTDYTVSRK